MRQSTSTLGGVADLLLAACLFFSSAVQAQLLAPVFTTSAGPVPVGSTFALTNINPGGAILFTTDGSDPRTSVGSVRTNALTYRRPVTINRTVTVQARVRLGTNWSELATATFTSPYDYSKLVISELAYQPPGTNGTHERSREFAEIKNVGTETLDISGVNFKGFVFPAGSSIGPGEFRVLIRNTNAFLADHPGARIDGVYLSPLNNGDAEVQLFHATGAELFSMYYGTYGPWPTLPDDHNFSEKGFSLMMADPAGHSDPHHYHSWRTSVFQGGSPGADDPPDARPRIKVTEVLARPGDRGHPLEAVELFNPHSTNVNIGGWYLSDQREVPQGFRLPPNTVVPAHGYLMLDETVFRTGTTNDLGFNSLGNDIYLFSASSNGTLTGYGHGFSFMGSERGFTYGLQTNSVGEEFFVPQLWQSLGAPNLGPLLGPAIVTEMMFHPPPGELRFIELENLTDGVLPLYDVTAPDNVWRIAFRIMGFDFPTNSTVPARSLFLIVEGNAEAFRTRYNVPAAVPIFGGLGQHFMEEEIILLYRYSGMSGPLFRTVPVESVEVKFRHPWPAGAYGTGYSLERHSTQEFGSDPRNWRLSPTGASPGRPNSGNQPPLVSIDTPQFTAVRHRLHLSAYVEDDGLPRDGTVTQLWSVVSSQGTVVISNATARLTPVWCSAPGTNLLQFMLDDGATSAVATVSVVVFAAPIDAWRARHFTSAELADPSLSGDAADADGDCRINVVEYALGGNPRVPDHVPPPRVEISAGRLSLSVRKAADTEDVTVYAEAADDITGPWSFSGVTVELESTAPDGWQTWRCRDESPGGAQRFLRLRLQRSEQARNVGRASVEAGGQ